MISRRSGGLLALAALTALVITGCGNVHENDPRPPIPTVVGVTVSDQQVNVSPEVAGAPGETGPRLRQNRNAPATQADPDAPLVTRFAVANMTGSDTQLELEGPVDHVQELTGSSSSSFSVSLPNGTYRLSSPASARSTRFTVKGSRISSAGDVLVP